MADAPTSQRGRSRGGGRTRRDARRVLVGAAGGVDLAGDQASSLRKIRLVDVEVDADVAEVVAARAFPEEVVA